MLIGELSENYELINDEDKLPQCKKRTKNGENEAYTQNDLSVDLEF